ncbi:flagellar basal-body MS-ring/collar protein FliF [Oceanobacillus sp. J11TS1]|uniref:flagellar basal-body MS-ring/collar protein FliF n=1 Tax=Oceanobacillus sp. J11TS1 TaxID=2807191 RepID=UPI001B0888D0|nr:flagellar basal-body MS-ring/collar protein FliF [Oceanobacillus sp. J11TS1]GIO21964.1 flagellar M-ring protein [Oceanobacillus sp. J11TS1]
MKERLQKWRESTSNFWGSRSKGQKGTILGGTLLILILIVLVIFFTTNTQYVPLYNDLSVQEAGQITKELDAKSVPYELENGGSSIMVPEENVDSLLLEFASMGLPSSGSIDYSFFSENASWGVTENEFSVMKLDAMQTELGKLIKAIDGIQDAQVMINMPEQPVFADDVTGETSVAIMIDTQPGYQFEGNQIEGLYHLVSKAVPNLKPEDIIIMNQYFEYYDRDTQFAGGGDTYSNQQTIKREVEKDIQRRLQQMLGTMVGNENIVVSVTADIDFSQENRTEELVDPVDMESMEGIPVSLESIQESYTGQGNPDDVAGTGEEDIANYPAGEGEDGEYELDKETINYEFNRVRREIVESPYKVRDLGIQVAVNNVRQGADGEVEYLNQQEQTSVQEGIDSILNSIIETSVDGDLQNEVTDANTSIVFQEFSTTTEGETQPETGGIPLWLYIVSGVLLLVIIILIVMLRRNRAEEEWLEEEQQEEAVYEDKETVIPDLQTEESEEVIRRKQLEKIANDKPEEFAKLLRSWMNED